MKKARTLASAVTRSGRSLIRRPAYVEPHSDFDRLPQLRDVRLER